MSNKSFTNKLCSDHNQRVNDGNMRESPGKDFYLQIMVNPRYILYIKHIKSIQNKGICLNLIYFIKTPGWRRRVAPPMLLGSRNKTESCPAFLSGIYLFHCPKYICTHVFVFLSKYICFLLQNIFVLLSRIYFEPIQTIIQTEQQ